MAAGEGIKFAGLLVDSFSSDGVFTDPPGFLKAAVDVNRAAARTQFFSPSFSLAAFLPWISTMARGFRFDGGHPVPPEWSPSAPFWDAPLPERYWEHHPGPSHGIHPMLTLGNQARARQSQMGYSGYAASSRI